MNALILSNALDTNGQNDRFRQAAERWGSDPSVLKAFAVGKTDPAGVVGRFQKAAEKYGGLRIRSAHRASAYFEFPHDIIWTRQTDGEVRSLAAEADVIHLNNSYMAAQRLALRKPMLLHHHGSMFRNNPEHMLAVAKSRRMVQAVSTIDLTRPDPKVLHWLPSAYNVDELAAFGKAHARKPDGRVRIVQCPTNREAKNTPLLEAVVAQLQADGLPVDLVLVENQTWEESLKAKAQADIVVDQLTFGYGCNSIEAWCMGKPVISGADPWTLTEMSRQWDGLPFYEATEATLKGVVANMVTDADLRTEYSEAGLAHVRKYHAEKPALERLAYLYAEAMRFYDRPRIAGKGAAATFRQTTHRPVYFEDDPIPFVEGQITTDDPLMIARLRALAQRPARFGIEEIA